MSPMVISLIVLGVVIVALVAIYNGLVGKKNNVENAFGSIDVMLKKRYDLIPNLVETVKQYMTHEKETLTQVTEMRAKAMSPGISNDQKIALENDIAKSMGGIMVAVESYPELKADQSFTMLQRSWNEIEEQISAARRAYNAAVTDYNNGIEMFPSSIIARSMNYQRKEVFVIPEVERQNVSAKDLFNS